MHFFHALDAIFEFAAVLGKLLGDHVDAAGYAAAKRWPDGDNLTDLELWEATGCLDLVMARGDAQLTVDAHSIQSP
jgi:hypothetical protein